MNGRKEGRDDSFDLGESSVQVRKGPPGRSLGRIVAAGMLVALGFLVGFFGLFFVGLWTGLFLASIPCGLGFSIYDYRWPFGPRPGMRPKSGQKSFEREAHGSEDY